MCINMTVLSLAFNLYFYLYDQYLGTRRLCSLFYPLCYAALIKILPIMLKLMFSIYLLCSDYAQYLYLSS